MKTVGRIVGVAALLVVLALVSVWLALRRPDLPWATLEAKYPDSANRYMDLSDGLRVRYRDQGRPDAPTLVLVHGFSASAEAWNPWIKALGSDYRIITLDLPGHGLTRAPAGFVVGPTTFVDVVDAVTGRLGAKHFVLAGNSMGGGVAWNYALAHSDKLDGLVLVDAAGWPHPAAKDGPVIFKILKTPLGRALLKDLDNGPLIKQGLVAAYFDPAIVTPALVNRYADFARAPGHRDILIGLQSGHRGAATDQALAAIRTPTLVMHARQDALIPFADGEHFAKTIPGATLEAYDGVGHVPMEQIPDRSARDLKAWLAAKVWPRARP